MTAVLDWTHDISELAATARVHERSAGPEELRRVAEALELIACERLSARYEITPLSEGRFRLTGSVQADVVQACVVTLESVAAHVDEPFDVEFQPGNFLTEQRKGELPVLVDTEAEPIEGGRIDVGRIVYEHLSGALDPYPRKEGAKLDWQEGEQQPPASSGPFAVLGRLKK